VLFARAITVIPAMATITADRMARPSLRREAATGGEKSHQA
jgi:hypothetical protein